MIILFLGAGRVGPRRGREERLQKRLQRGCRREAQKGEEREEVGRGGEGESVCMCMGGGKEERKERGREDRIGWGREEMR